jgi:glutathione S-transferase
MGEVPTSNRVLYDLAGAEDDRRFSPYCWRSKMALAHKGLEVETVPWRFTEKETIRFSRQGRVPVLVDGGHVVADSWAIAVYLEETYPDRPSLFGGQGGRAVTRFVNGWADMILNPGVARLIMADIFLHLHERDREYFRRTREERFGAALEAVSADRDATVVEFRRTLHPLRGTLEHQSYLGGEAPNYADYIIFGAFQWARSVSDFLLLEGDDPVAAWREKLLQAFGGLAERAKGYAVIAGKPP